MDLGYKNVCCLKPLPLIFNSQYQESNLDAECMKPIVLNQSSFEQHKSNLFCDNTNPISINKDHVYENGQNRWCSNMYVEKSLRKKGKSPPH